MNCLRVSKMRLFLGGYDIVFLLKVLIDYNDKNEDRYRLF